MSGTPLVGFSIPNALAPMTKIGADGAPIQGPRSIPYVLAFTAAQNVLFVELFQENQDRQLDFVQTLFIDNSASALAISVRSFVLNQTLIIPPFCQAYLPVVTLHGAQTQLNFSKAAVGNENIPVQLINVAMQAAVWSTIAPTTAISQATPGVSNAVSLKAFQGAVYDLLHSDPINVGSLYTSDNGSANFASSQINVGVVSTQIVPARLYRRELTITNLGAQDIFIGINGVTVGTGDLLLGAKGSKNTYRTTAAVFGIAAIAQLVTVSEVYNL